MPSDFGVWCGKRKNPQVEKEGVFDDIQRPSPVDTTSKYNVHKQKKYCYNNCQQVNVGISTSVQWEYEEEDNAN